MLAALGSGVTRPEKKTGPLAEFPPAPSLPRVYCRGATIARSLPLVHIRVILPFVIEYYKLILWFILWCIRFVFHARYWSDQQSLPCMVEVDKRGHTKKLYAVAQFNEKPNFPRPNSNYISSLSCIRNGREYRARLRSNYNRTNYLKIRKTLLIIHRTLERIVYSTIRKASFNPINAPFCFSSARAMRTAKVPQFYADM